MGKGNLSEPTPEPVAIPVEDEELARAKEAQVLPWHLGTRLLPGQWISRAYAERNVEAPAERPAKK